MIAARLTARLPMLLAAALCAALASAALAADDPPDEKQWVDSGHEALSDGNYPWYDSQSDSLRRVKTPRRSEWDLGWLAELLGAAIKIIAWTALGLAILGLVALVIHFARNREAAAITPQQASDDLITADRVEALPFLAERPRGDLLALARRHYEEGNYSEAIIYLFSYELLQLDKFSVIQLARGKTNRQYLREVGRQSALRSPLEQTLVTFESVFFGRRALDRAGFEACWHQLPQFEQQLQAT